MPDDQKFPSPTGSYFFFISPWEARMSHWIESPELLDSISGTPILRFQDPNWSLDHAEWLSESIVKLQLRKYPGDHTPSSFAVTIDCEKQTTQVQDPTAIPLEKVEAPWKRSIPNAGGADNGRSLQFRASNITRIGG